MLQRSRQLQVQKRKQPMRLKPRELLNWESYARQEFDVILFV
jgi:hypothetical protein